MQIKFTVPGNPQGKGRPKFARRGNFVAVYTPAKTASYENLIKIYAAEAMAGHPAMAGAVEIELLILIMPPASWSNKRRLAALAGLAYPITKPDADNVLKGVCDACNGIVFVDDKQVVDFKGSKRYNENSGCIITVIEKI